MAYAPTLTVFVDDDPAPRVEVLFSAFAPGTTTVTVYRLAEGRAQRVRSAVSASTAGGLSRLDFEVPFGVPVSYRAEMFDTFGVSLGYTDSSSVYLDIDETWVHNPIDPAGSVRVDMLAGAAAVLSRPGQGEVVYPEGRHVGVLISGARRGLQGVDLTCLTRTIGDADRFGALFGTYNTDTAPVLCFRISARLQMLLPRPLFAAVLDPRQVPINLHIGRSDVRWESKGDEVAPPTPALVVSLLRRQDINAYYATKAAVKADNLTRLAVNRRYDLAGTV